jgi:tRNA(Ile)-lysidine synthase
LKTLTKFLNFIKTQHLFRKRDRVLLAVSGGLDSMVMCDLFLKAGFEFGIAHVNYELRGEDSEGDQQLVRDYAEKHELPFFTTNFPTERLAKEQKKSIQEIARELRYQWLESVRGEQHFNYIATAHHLNDSLETILFNWTKGTSLKGLMGIPVCNDFIIRPLLGLTRAELEAYAADQQIAYRLDQSNTQTKYDRNKIRLEVMPVLKSINPKLEATVSENLQYLDDVHSLYYWSVFHILKKSWSGDEKSSSLNFKILEQFPAPATILFEWLSPFGFNGKQTAQIWNGRERQPGAIYHSNTHELLVDRETFILQPRKEKNKWAQTYTLEKDVAFLQVNEAQLFIEYNTNLPEVFSEDPYMALLDADLLQFPLTLRHWRKGDQFCPLGMNGQTKKLQDFFTDQKLPRTEKDKVWIVEDAAGRICWLIGLRLDDRFKITSETQQLIKMIYQP